MIRVHAPIIAASVLSCSLFAPAQSQPKLHAEALTLKQVKASDVTYKGKTAVRLDDDAPATAGDAGRLAVLKSSAFTNGSIEVDVTGDTAPNADPAFRGFVGLAFRVSDDMSRFECIYLRPKNGRSDDQLQRNHSAQYISVPGFPWQKLRSENPGKYETYVDLVPGEWTHVHIVVAGQTAKLYLNHAAEPTLIVSDLKQPIAAGSIALWIGPGSIAHFANLRYSAETH